MKQRLHPPASRPPVHHQPGTGLNAAVARVNELRRQAIALLRQTPSNKV